MWNADNLGYRNNTQFIKAYKGSELVWSKIKMELLGVKNKTQFRIKKTDGTYFVLNSTHDVEVTFKAAATSSSFSATLVSSQSRGDYEEYQLFWTGANFYYDLGYKYNRRVITQIPITEGTTYTVQGCNGNYLHSTNGIYVNGTLKKSGTISTYNNLSDVTEIGNGNIYILEYKIYDRTGLLYDIVPVAKDDSFVFYDKVSNKECEFYAEPTDVELYHTGEYIVG